MNAAKWILVLMVMLVPLVFVGMCMVFPTLAHAQATSWSIGWTAPGDDGMVGTALSTGVFYSQTTPDTTGLTPWLDRGALLADTPAGIQAWRNGARNRPGPAPLLAGSLQTFAIQDSFPAGVKQWAMVKTCDDGLPAAPGASAAPNCSYSNFVVWVPPAPVDVRAPAAVRDLKTRAAAVSP